MNPGCPWASRAWLAGCALAVLGVPWLWCFQEGLSVSEKVELMRQRQMRNFMVALMVSQGAARATCPPGTRRPGPDSHGLLVLGQGSTSRLGPPTAFPLASPSPSPCLPCLAQGVPMILMGDEYGHTKEGNNNTYCHDTEVHKDFTTCSNPAPPPVPWPGVTLLPC